jgi:dinuclear metal center YbgI/SA1388 family protein
MHTVDAVVSYFDQFAPPSLAAEWDNVGLLLGDRAAPVERIMTCLTVTPASAAEAIERQAQLIVTHHPIMFRPVNRLTTANAEGRMLLSLIRAGVAVYCPHTALDNTRDGINELLAGRLGLTDVRPLRLREAARQCKLVVFVPDSDLARVYEALFAAGAGNIGQYSQCSFRTSGTGTFFGSDAANPTVGQKGRREEVAEWRLEAICAEATVDRVVTAMRQAHSYEEPAYDVYPLRPGWSPLGEGRIGQLRTPVALEALARTVKASFNAPGIQVVGELNRTVARVAIVCGAGGGFVNEAVQANADVLLTGEARFHDALAAEAQGLALLLPGHYATERQGVEDVAERLQRQFPKIHVWASCRERDPLQCV